MALTIPNSEADLKIVETEVRSALVEHHVPEHLHYGLVLYTVYGVPPGDFMKGVLSNDLMKALGHGSEDSLAGLVAIGRFVWNVLPVIAYGSIESYESWVVSGGMRRFLK